MMLLKSKYMCLGVPGKVTLIKGGKARIKQGGHFHWVDITSLKDQVKTGDYLISYQGIAINKILPKEAREILKLMDSASNAGIKGAD